MPVTKQSFHDLETLRSALERLGLSLPLGDPAVLGQPLSADGHTFANRLVIQPMEGCDGTPEGRPGELTRRRYLRFAASGASLIWFEATAVLPEARANPRQLYLTAQTLDAFKSLLDEIRETAVKETGYAPVIIMQATHSGRYSKPNGVPAPLIARHNPIFEKDGPVGTVLSDDDLKRVETAYGETAKLAVQAGFDGMDVKCCHGYLNAELLSAFTREGDYGGSFENRTRLFRNMIDAVKAVVPPSFMVTTRTNIYDGFPYPYGFGVAQDNSGLLAFDPTEPLQLMAMLHDRGLRLVDITMGNPYVNPSVNRPFNGTALTEDPLAGVVRMLDGTRQMKQAFPDMTFIASAFSYLKAQSAPVAAGMVAEGWADMAGFGRMAFAYPTFARDILEKGALDPKRCCLACGQCSVIMRAGSTPGCPVFDRDIYLPLLKAVKA